MTTAAAPDSGRSEYSGQLALIAVQLCFGTFPVLGKLAFEGFEPRSIAAWRMVIGSAAFLALAFAIHGRRAIPARGDLWRLLLCSMLGVTINQVLYLEGLERTTAIHSGLLMLLIPVFTFTIAVGVRQERFSVVRGIGILIAGIGMIYLVLQRAPGDHAPHLLGNVLIAINTLCYSIYLVISKPLARRYPSLVLITWVYVLSVWTTPLFAWGTAIVPDAPASAWMALGLILVFPTVLGYLLNMFALARVPASTTAVWVLVQPLITAVAALMILREPLAEGTVFAAVAIFIGIWLVVRRR